uniref:Na+/H+ antiporter n=1 Tax=uncultured organism TaxID=155900 RepID=A0A0G2YFP2_9ZZZZ|nr:Na+/H+ antiporter [uncultured organism]
MLKNLFYGMDNSDQIFLAFLEISIFITVAQAFHLASLKYKLPSIFGEILTGIILGPFALGTFLNSIIGLNVFTINNYLILFSQFSVILLIFAAGLEHGFRSLRSSGLYALLAASIGAILPFVGVYYVMTFFTSKGVALLMGAAAGATSLAAISSIIEGMGIQGEKFVKILTSSAAIDDVVSFIILSIALSLIEGIRGGYLGLLKTASFVIISWVIILLASVLIIPRLLSIVSDNLVVETSLMILFILTVIMITLGFSPIIAAFIAGIAIAESRKAERIKGMVTALLSIFGSIFFVTIGAETNVLSFVNLRVLEIGLILTALASLLKFAGILPFAFLYTKKMKHAIMTSFGMIPRGEMGLVIASLAFADNIFSEDNLSEVVFMSLLTTIIGGMFFNLSVRKWLASFP